jgi:plasmid stabilization system protein ParE
MGKARAYHPAVADDLKAATHYYDAISADLGDRFRADVRHRLSDIEYRPELFGRVRNDIRAAGVRRFPYVILFTVERRRVFILGIFHARSDQEGWFARLGP